MPLAKPRRRGSELRRYNHLDALGGIELKAYIKQSAEHGASDPQGGCADVVSAVVRIRWSEPGR